MKRKINKIYILFFTLLFAVSFISFSANLPNGNSGDLTITNSISESINPDGPDPLVLIVSTDVSCFGGNDGTAIAQGSGGTPGYTYAWSNGATGTTISNLITGTYTVTVTDALALTGTASIMIEQPSLLSLSLINQTNVDCFGNNTGSATVNGSGGTTGYSYVWSNGGSGATNINLPAGTYTATITDGNLCTSTEVVTITQPAAISLLASSTNVTCNGDNNGTATASGSGGGGSFSYAWSNGLNGQTISNLAGGTYTVSATDANNCIEVQTVTVIEPNAITLNISPTNISCNGANNASATAMGNGGAGGFTYDWSNGMSGATISNLSAGTYTATATDVDNCTQTQTVSFTEPSAISVTISPNNISCNGINNGSASAFGSGGAGGFSYAWSNGMNGQMISNLSVGTYTVTATDVTNCSEIEVVTISEPTEIIITTTQNNILCNGENNGLAAASGSGGTGSLNYVWSNGISGSSISNLSAGTYTVTATDANNCEKTEIVTISEPNVIVVNISQTNILCNGENNGSASANGSGGTGSFNYVWSNGANTATISNLPPGTYTTTATDANGCFQTEEVTISESPTITLNISPNEISCNNSNNGSATAAGNGGSGNFTYAWSNGLNGATILNLAAGTYTVSATDANNCIETETVTLTNPTSISLTVTQTDVDCFGNSNGSATASGNGGTGNLTYTWSNGTSGTTLSNLAPGTYTASATDANNCVQTETITIIQPNEITISTSQTNVICFGNSDGSAIANGSGGTGNLTYAWSNGTSDPNISNLVAGTYTLTVTDGNNCTSTESIIINQPSNLIANASATGETSANSNDGTATAAPSGGSSGYTYSWSTGSSNQTITNLPPGGYTVTITDNNMCTAEETVIVSTFNCTISINVTTTDPPCFGETGSATASTQNGADPVTYLWSTGEMTATISNLTPGTYTASATDANNCIQIETITINQPNEITISTSQTDVICFGNSDGSAIANGSGGTGNLTYAWSNGINGENLSNLTAGTYTLTVTDSNNCTATESVIINQPTNLIANASATDETSASANDGTATAAPSGGNSGYTYSWSTGSSNQTITNLPPGGYTVTITDNNMCTAEETVIVNSFNCTVSINVTTTDAPCFGETGSATASAQNGTDPVIYLWSTGEMTASISNLTPEVNYSVTVTDANNCPASMSISISQPPLLQITESTTDVSCNGLSDGSVVISVAGGTAPFSYTLPNGDGTGLSAGLYTASVLDGNNCFINIDFEITEPSVISPNTTTTDLTASGANDGTATANPSGGVGNFNFLWSNGMTTSMINNLAPGDYTVTVSDANNCMVTQTVTVNDVGCAISISTTLINVSCFGDSNGSATVSVNTGIAPFNYLWSNGGMTETITSLVAGTYTVTVTDNNNCPVSETVTISQPDLLELTQSPQSVLQLDCFGDNNGVAAINVAGGAGGNSFNWSNGATGNPISNLSSGTLTGTLTDANGCFQSISFTISQPDELIANATSTNETASNSNDGTATVSPSGGTGMINYLWSNGATISSINNLTPGVYTVTATDANGCESIESVNVIAFGCSLTATVSTINATCSDASDGSATATPSGGQNYTYAWSSGGNSPTEMNLLPGTYSVTINDASNCTFVETVTIQAVDNILPTAITQNIPVSLDGNGNATITPSMIDNGSLDNCGGVTLDIGITSFDCDDLGENTVILTVSDLAGNQDTTTAIVTVNDLLPPTISCPTDIVIDQCTGLVTYGDPTLFDNCSAPNLILMGPASGTIFPAGETIITMIANDQSGNSTSCTFTVTIDHVLELDVSFTDSPCANENLGTASAVATGTSATFDYIWSNGQTTSNIMNLAPNTYTVTVTDDSGCTSTEEVVIAEAPPIEIIIDNIIAESDINASDGAIEVSINGGVGPLNYNWTLNGNTVSTNEDPTGLTGGIYILTIIDQNGCTVVSSEITVDIMVDNENLILESDIRLFPNPVKDLLFLDFDLVTNFDLNISIYDGIGNVLSGKNVTNISSQKLKLDVSNLASGLYFVKIQTGGQIWIRKFIIQN